MLFADFIIFCFQGIRFFVQIFFSLVQAFFLSLHFVPALADIPVCVGAELVHFVLGFQYFFFLRSFCLGQSVIDDLGGFLGGRTDFFLCGLAAMRHTQNET